MAKEAGNRVWNCVGFGLCAFDTLLLVERYPELDEKTDALAMEEQGGGPVATAMAALGRLGEPDIAFVGKVGGDPAGDFVLSALRQDGVNTDFVARIPGAPTAHAFVWIERRSGKRSVVLYRDRRLLFRPDEIDPGPFSTTRLLLIDGREPEAAIQAAAIARNSGAKVVMDAGSLRPRMERFFRLVDHFVCSRDFIRAFRPTEKLERAVREIHRMGPPEVVVTLGREGSLAFDGRRFYREPAFPVQVTDTTGAGDVFHGAYLFALRRGWPLPNRLIFANAVAALKCRKIGGRKGIPTLGEVVQFLESVLQKRGQDSSWLTQLKGNKKMEVTR